MVDPLGLGVLGLLCQRATAAHGGVRVVGGIAERSSERLLAEGLRAPSAPEQNPLGEWMALPDKKPPTEKVLEYICVGCWSSFTVEAASRDDDDGVIVCPSCGHSQPKVDEVFGSSEQPRAEHSAEADVVELDADSFEVVEDEAEPPGALNEALEPVEHSPSAGQPQDASLDIPLDVEDGIVPPTDESPATDIPVSFESDEPEANAGAGEMLESWETANPDTVTWKMRTSGGITFNFHGIGALMAWASSKKNLGRATLTVEGRQEWADFTEFSTIYRKLRDPLAALKLVGRQVSVPVDEKDDDAGEALLSMVDAADAASGVPTLSGMPGTGDDFAADEGDGARVPRTGQNRPGASAKTTTDFTFITKVNAGKRGGRAIPFMLGLLLGAATVLVLWYVGVLDMLPLRPM